MDARAVDAMKLILVRVMFDVLLSVDELSLASADGAAMCPTSTHICNF
jgi:hypothetical protein